LNHAGKIKLYVDVFVHLPQKVKELHRAVVKMIFLFVLIKIHQGAQIKVISPLV